MRLSLLSSLVLCFTLASCGTNDVVVGGEGTPKDETANVKSDLIVYGSKVRLMPKSNPAGIQTNAAPANSHLNYYGGKIIPNVKVHQVNWGTGVNPSIINGMPDFYTTITSSNMWDWLAQEYSTTGKNGFLDGLPGSNQVLGRGSFGSTVTISPSVTSATITDTQIQAELNAKIASGQLPAPDDNAIYMINFPPGKRITQGSPAASSCVDFCAYHGTFVRNGQNVYYSVLPSLTGACATGCGPSSEFQNYTSVASHELVEALTDAEVGLGSVIGRPLAWYDPVGTHGEIGDICNGQQGTITSPAGTAYTVQTEFSNAANDCVVTRNLGGSTFGVAVSPAAATVNAGSSVAFSVTTTATGAAQSVALSVAGLPAGVTGAFSPATVSSGGSSTLTLTAAASAGSVTKSFTVTGAGTSSSQTASGSLTVVATTTGGDTVIANGQTIAGQSASLNAETFYRVDVPAGVALKVTLAGANGDADLFVKSVSKPTTAVFDCKSDGSTSNETCTIASTVAGSYFVLVKAFAAYTGLSVSASWSVATGGGDPTLVRGVAVTALAGATGNQKFWQIDVPAGTASLKVAITGGTGDADLYVNPGARPSKTTFTCRPFLNGNSESCTIANPAAGKMFVLIDGFAAYSGVTLTAN
jgi:Bacterial pre-peptidase C-terminal domain